MVLRVFVAAAGDSWAVMPGGLARVSPSLDSPVVSMQRGGGSKDTWVLSDAPVDRFTLQRPRDQPVALNRGASDLPSRAADNLFWLGRYAERCEHLARVLRCILVRVTGEFGANSNHGGSVNVEWNSLIRLHAYAGIRGFAHGRKTIRRVISISRTSSSRRFLSLIFEEQRRTACIRT